MLSKELIQILSQNPEDEVQIVGWYAGGLPDPQPITNSHIAIQGDKIYIGAEPLEWANCHILIEKPAKQPKIEDGEPQTEN
jgi:hypothetical protein